MKGCKVKSISVIVVLLTHDYAEVLYLLRRFEIKTEIFVSSLDMEEHNIIGSIPTCIFTKGRIETK